MKPVAIGILLFCLISRSYGLETSSSCPLLTFYDIRFDAPPPHPASNTIYGHLGSPMLVIYKLSQVYINSHQEGKIILTPEDAKIFSRLTRSHQFLLMRSWDSSSGVVLHLNGSIENGTIALDRAHGSEAIAKYLIRRLHIEIPYRTLANNER